MGIFHGYNREILNWRGSFPGIDQLAGECQQSDSAEFHINQRSETMANLQQRTRNRAKSRFLGAQAIVKCADIRYMQGWSGGIPVGASWASRCELRYYEI